MNIFAYTAKGANYPEYVSVNEREGKCSITVRSLHNPDGTEGPSAVVELDAIEAAELSLALSKWVRSQKGMDTIFINGESHLWPHDKPLSHKKICELAGQSVYATVTYHVRGSDGLRRDGTTDAGRIICVDPGMRISCIWTGDA